MARIVILAPLLPEARAAARAVGRMGAIRCRFADRVEANDDFAVAIVGVGAPHLSIIKELKPRALILAGLAGGLAPQLRVGDLVLDQPLALKGLAIPVHVGKLHNSSHLVTNQQDKLALHQRTNALAVEMESTAVEIFAHALTVPLLNVRSISDTAAQALDPAFLNLVDDEGRPRTMRAMRLLARRPGKLPSMLRLGRAARLALKHLTAGVEAVLSSGWPDAGRG
jgi:nucleoside phosphorylase